MADSGSMDLREKLRNHLQRSPIYCKDIEEVVEKLSIIAQDGTEKFQFLTDYDRTLTYRTYNGKEAVSSFGAIDGNPLIDKAIRDEADSIRSYYYGIELSNEYTIEEKTAHMEEWWRTAEKLIAKANIYKDDLSKLLNASTLRLRQGTHELMALLERHDIPVLILSAGIADVITEGFHQQSVFRKNIEIISNVMMYNDDGLMTGFKGTVIHSYNKTKASEHNASYFENNKNRDNMILMGDMDGDLHMADGINYLRNKVTIGFLNTKVEELLEPYMNLFDIVVAGDESMDNVNTILLTMFGE